MENEQALENNNTVVAHSSGDEEVYDLSHRVVRKMGKEKYG
jgi:hypothetical protein